LKIHPLDQVLGKYLEIFFMFGGGDTGDYHLGPVLKISNQPKEKPTSHIKNRHLRPFITHGRQKKYPDNSLDDDPIPFAAFAPTSKVFVIRFYQNPGSGKPNWRLCSFFPPMKRRSNSYSVLKFVMAVHFCHWVKIQMKVINEQEIPWLRWNAYGSERSDLFIVQDPKTPREYRLGFACYHFVGFATLLF